MSLIQEVGRDFFNRKYEGSFFLNDNNKPSILLRADDDGAVHHREIGGSIDRLLVKERTVSADFFTGHETFSTPPLGWRCRSRGRIMSYFSRNNRGYHRGLCVGNLTLDHSPMTRWMLQSGNVVNDLSENTKCIMAMKPEYMPFLEGLAEMRAGKIVSFAASASLAVVVDEADTFSIFFRQNKAGTVLPDNTVVVDLPILSTYLGDLR